MNNFAADSTNSLEEIDFIEKYLSQSSFFLEFGSGASTLMALKNSAVSVFSIETNPKYVEFLKLEIQSQGLSLDRVYFCLVDIGPTGEWGKPVDFSQFRKFPNYQTWPFAQAILQNFKPDLVLIDGRFRIAAFLNSIIHFRDTTILFDDYYDRPQYSVVEKALKPFLRCGRIAVFHSPPSLESEEILRINTLVAQHLFHVD